MNTRLFVVVQTPKPGPYTSLITYCVKHFGIKEIVFILSEVTPEEESRQERLVQSICGNIQRMANDHPNSDYKLALPFLPSNDKIKDSIFRIDFIRPHLSLSKLKTQFKDLNESFFDITGAGKQLAGDILVSFLTNNIEHVSHFVLSDETYEPNWRLSGKTQNYHDVISDEGVSHCTYQDFSKSDPILASIKSQRRRSHFLRYLLMLSMAMVLLAILLFVVQQTNAAVVTAITAVFALVATLVQITFNINQSFTKDR